MSGLNYSQCWEDADLLKEALAISGDDIVLSITSGGDNTLAMLLEKPKKIFSIDINPVQNYLAELKLKSSKVLSHEQYLKLLGVSDSNERLNYYYLVSDYLSEEASLWFQDNTGVIKSGIVHCGKFEKYLNSFRKYLLPLVHSTRIVFQFVNQRSLEDQVVFYNSVWNTWRWKIFFSIASNSSLLRKFARQTGAASGQIVNNSYLKRLEKLIHRRHIKTNYYLRYALVGDYGESLPDYLLMEKYGTLQDSVLGVCEFKHADLLSFLEGMSNSSLTKYNLSDAFEFLAAKDVDKIWKEIIRTAKNTATVVYWCNQIEHIPSEDVMHNLIQKTDIETRLKKQDRLYFYKNFHVYTIKK